VRRSAAQAAELPDVDRREHGALCLGEPVDPLAAADLDAARHGSCSERLGDAPGAALDARIAVALAERGQQRPEDVAGERGGRCIGVERIAGEQAPGEGVLRSREQSRRPGLAREQQAGARLRERRRHPAQDGRFDARPDRDEFRPAHPHRGLGHVPREHGARAVERRVGQHERPVPPRDLEPERPEDGRCGAKRVEGAEAVVDETGFDRLARGNRAARLRLRLEHDHRPARVGENVRRHEAVVTGSDDDGVRQGARHKRHPTAASAAGNRCHKRWYAPHRCSPSDRRSHLPGPAAC